MGQGHKALVEADSRMSFMDVALKEIADCKLGYELADPEIFAEAERFKTRKRKPAAKKSS